MKYGIIVAAGKSTRVGPKVDKAFLTLGTKPVLAHSLMAYEACPDIDGVILVVRKDRVDAARSLVHIFGCSKVRKIISGGSSRQASVQKGLAECGDEVNIVSIHDGARPLITPALISDTIDKAKRTGSAVAAVKITDTVKHVESGYVVSKTVDRTKLWSVQTPQTFKKDLLVKAFKEVNKRKVTVTDEASAVELISKVHLISSPVSNIKITTADDLVLAGALLKL